MEKLLSLEGIVIFWFCVARISGLFMSMPLLGSSFLPRQVKVAFAIVLGFLVFSTSEFSQNFILPSHFFEYFLLFAGEVGVGLLIGYGVRVLFIGVQLAGQIIGFQMGLGMAELLDLQEEVNLSVISQFKNILAMMIFLSLNAHYFCLKALFDSFKLIPIGKFYISAPLVKEFSNLVGSVFVISLKGGVPVILTLFLVQIVMGVINRVIPQVNIFMISLPLKIMIGIIVIGLSMPYFLYFLENLFGEIYQNLTLLLVVAGGKI